MLVLIVIIGRADDMTHKHNTFYWGWEPDSILSQKSYKPVLFFAQNNNKGLF